MLSSFDRVRPLSGHAFQSRKPRTRRHSARLAPHIELLETRIVPSITVTGVVAQAEYDSATGFNGSNTSTTNPAHADISAQESGVSLSASADGSYSASDSSLTFDGSASSSVVGPNNIPDLHVEGISLTSGVIEVTSPSIVTVTASGSVSGDANSSDFGAEFIGQPPDVPPIIIGNTTYSFSLSGACSFALFSEANNGYAVPHGSNSCSAQVQIAVSPAPQPPQIVLDSASKLDRQNIEIDYTISGADVTQPLEFDVYQADQAYTDTASLLASVTAGNSVLLGQQTIPTSDTADLSQGSQELDVSLPAAIPVDPTKPYIVVVANEDGSVDEAPNSVNVLPEADLYSPSQISTAYGINLLPYNGSGQTIAIILEYADPKIQSDLANFDAFYKLPNPALSIMYMNSVDQTQLTTTNLSVPVDTTGYWESEAAQDVEWAHALAPGANILLVECDPHDSYSGLVNISLGAAFAARQPGVSVVSINYNLLAELPLANEKYYDNYFTSPDQNHQVTFLAATGDFGGASTPPMSGSGYPAYSPNVVAVGGTTLMTQPDGSYDSETGWSYGSDGPPGSLDYTNASGGGASQYEPEPLYQFAVQSTGNIANPASGHRTIPDVSFDADPNTGVYAYDSYNVPSGGDDWTIGDGTSLATPCWAALIALADQGRAMATTPLPPLDGATQTLPVLYSLPSADFNDDLGGDNGTNNGPGSGIINPAIYDEVTGLGSPKANMIVPALAAWQEPPITLSPVLPSLPSGTVGTAYNQVFTAGGGTGVKRISFIVTSETPIPAGLTFTEQSNELVITGTPTAAGTVTFDVAVADGTGTGIAPQDYTLTINPLNVTSQVSVSSSGLVYNRMTQLFVSGW